VAKRPAKSGGTTVDVRLEAERLVAALAADPEDFRARIFSKFSHADSGEARHKGGVGLGLYITRQLVEQMRGNIGFASEVGSGTTFWVEFPCVTRGQRQLRA